MESRTNNFEKEKFLTQYPYLKIGKKEGQESKMIEILNAAPIRSRFEPYQQKICYDVVADSSDTDQKGGSEDEDALFARE